MTNAQDRGNELMHALQKSMSYRVVKPYLFKLMTVLNVVHVLKLALKER